MRIKRFFKKSLPGLIILFWLVMMGALINREVVSVRKASAYQPFLSRNRLLSDDWMGIYFNNAPIGFVHSSVEPVMIGKGLSGYRISNRTWMNFLLMQRRNKVWFNAEAIVDEDYQLQNFSFELNSGLHTLKVKGKMKGKQQLLLEIESPGRTTQKQITLPQDKGIVIANIISPFSSFGALKEGERYSIKVFNPFTLDLEPLDIAVGPKETMEFEGQPVEVFVVKSVYRGLEQKAWVNERGEILKQETGMGWVLIREEAGKVSRMYHNAEKTDVELAELVSVACNMPLAPESMTYMKLALSGIPEGFSLENQRQKIIANKDGKMILEINKDTIQPENALALPIEGMKEFLSADDFIQVFDAQIQRYSRDIVQGERNSFLAAKKINKWVFEHISKVAVVSVPSAVDVLKTREGDCNEHTALFTALARSAGIPARINVGLAYANGRFYYHAWPSVYVGRWVDMDPTFGQDIADAAHIRLIEGDLNKQLDVVRLLGKIKVEVIEYR
ncbi:MAG: transglutaminase-like domain-containing protein [Candidatus Omnitrophica bacterium]|nr:transglutaminase-like domain-containing protein [Candidatus Omnitrophota bacterium]MBU4478264.1 transglutaminase-like domain-containing protein [Candidatus Omnitrophota bacterium]MCG2703332.1 transglutaminase-like domain-containing protein [Candidatus Omnitrophota bacterium]